MDFPKILKFLQTRSPWKLFRSQKKIPFIIRTFRDLSIALCFAGAVGFLKIRFRSMKLGEFPKFHFHHPTHAGEIHPVRDFSDTLLNVFSYKQDRFHAVLRLISHETLSLRKIIRIKFVTFHRKLRWVWGRPTSNVKSSVVPKWSANLEHSESLMKMDFRTSVVHAFYQ